jgi:intein/homing endonuclease
MLEVGTFKKYYNAADSNVGRQEIPKWLLRALGIGFKTSAKKKAQPIEITP